MADDLPYRKERYRFNERFQIELNCLLDEYQVIEILLFSLNTLLVGEIVIYFFRQAKKTREPLGIYLGLCFAGFLGASVFYFIHIFFIYDPLLWRIGVTFRFSGLALFVFVFEKKVRQLRVPIFTILSAVCISLILFLPSFDLAYYFGLSIYGAAVALLLFFILVYLQMEGKVKRFIGWGIFGGLIWGAGVGVTSDFMVQQVSQYFLDLGLLLQMIGLIILGLSFTSIRSLDEFLWSDKIQTLFVLYNSLCIFAYSFERGTKLEQGDLLGGGLASALIAMQSIVQSEEPPETIDYKDLVFIIKPGEITFSGGRCTAILLAKKRLTIAKEKLSHFIHNFELQYSPHLQNWTGNTNPLEEHNEDLLKIFHAKKGGLHN